MTNMNKIFLGKNFEFGGTIRCQNNNGNDKGVYLVVVPETIQQVEFTSSSCAFKLRGKDPTVSLAKLQNKWVDDAILYIGKSESTVRKRMQQHIDFWQGKPAVAWGGRIIAQIVNYEELEIWYLLCDNPKQMERDLLEAFCSIHDKKLPFANFRK